MYEKGNISEKELSASILNFQNTIFNYLLTLISTLIINHIERFIISYISLCFVIVAVNCYVWSCCVYFN